MFALINSVGLLGLNAFAAYPADKKVSEDEYHRRLTFCKDCEKLVDGMCVLCGCYVELRALKIGMRCADIDKKW